MTEEKKLYNLEDIKVGKQINEDETIVLNKLRSGFEKGKLCIFTDVATVGHFDGNIAILAKYDYDSSSKTLNYIDCDFIDKNQYEDYLNPIKQTA